jgi:hypothetical protein
VEKDKWEGHRAFALGTYSSEAAVITRVSSYTVVNVTATSSNLAVQLPLTRPSTVGLVEISTEVTPPSTHPAPTYAEVGDVVDVCVDPNSLVPVYVWYGATTKHSARGSHYEQVDPGKCRMYRYVSGAIWNRYT